MVAGRVAARRAFQFGCSGVWTADAVFDIVASVLPYGAGDLSREAVEGC